jgi:hypothetical protein
MKENVSDEMITDRGGRRGRHTAPTINLDRDTRMTNDKGYTGVHARVTLIAFKIGMENYKR